MDLNKTRPWVLSIDFDGTICEDSFPEVGEMKEEADKYIKKLYNEGFFIVINTCRTGLYEGMAQTFLEGAEIPYHYINANMPFLVEEYGQDCRKLSADVYIDNKCLMGIPKTWKEIYERIIKLKENDNRN